MNLGRHKVASEIPHIASDILLKKTTQDECVLAQSSSFDSPMQKQQSTDSNHTKLDGEKYIYLVKKAVLRTRDGMRRIGIFSRRMMNSVKILTMERGSKMATCRLEARTKGQR